MADYPEVRDEDVVYYLRDKNKELVESWKQLFANYPENFKVNCKLYFCVGV